MFTTDGSSLAARSAKPSVGVLASNDPIGKTKKSAITFKLSIGNLNILKTLFFSFI
jgi:hypothetical protein